MWHLPSLQDQPLHQLQQGLMKKNLFNCHLMCVFLFFVWTTCLFSLSYNKLLIFMSRYISCVVSVELCLMKYQEWLWSKIPSWENYNPSPLKLVKHQNPNISLPSSHIPPIDGVRSHHLSDPGLICFLSTTSSLSIVQAICTHACSLLAERVLFRVVSNWWLKVDRLLETFILHIAAILIGRSSFVISTSPTLVTNTYH